jgi:formyl-CoA transferase
MAQAFLQRSRNSRAVTSFRPALDGIRVLELGSSVAGPAAGRLLADLGADVIKVEPPEGDGLRTWGKAAPDGTGWWFKSHNRNKRFVSYDLHRAEDRATVRALALSCDVVIENFRPGRLAEWGLGYDDLRAERPGLIYASISGYGQDGRYRDRPGFGNIAESMGGLRHITGDPDGPPMRVGISLGDELGALYCVVGILAALRARERDGVGDWIDVSLLESVFAMMQGVLPEYDALGIVRERRGNTLDAVGPSNIYPTADDRWIAIGANANSIFRRLCTLMQMPELAADARFIGNRERTENSDAIDAIVAAWTKNFTLAALTEMLATAGVPAGPVRSIADIVDDPHSHERGIVSHISDDDGNPVATNHPVTRFRNRPTVLSHAARAIGADTAAVERTLR